MLNEFGGIHVKKSGDSEVTNVSNCTRFVQEKRNPRSVATLMQIQVEIMAKVRQRDLVTAGKIEPELALREIRTWLRKSIDRKPGFSLPDFGNDFRRRDANLECAKTLLVAFVRNLCVAYFLSIADIRAVKIVVVDLKEIVVVRVDVVQDPLQAMTLRQHGGKDKNPGRWRNPIEDIITAFTDENALFFFPACRVVPARHAGGSEGKVESTRLPSRDVHRCCTYNTVIRAGGKRIDSRRQTHRVAITNLDG